MKNMTKEKHVMLLVHVKSQKIPKKHDRTEWYSGREKKAVVGCIRAEDILPEELVKILQEYAEGQMIYVSRKKSGAGWGTLFGKCIKKWGDNRIGWAHFCCTGRIKS